MAHQIAPDNDRCGSIRFHRDEQLLVAYGMLPHRYNLFTRNHYTLRYTTMHTNSSQPLMPQLRRALDKAEPLALVYHQQANGAQQLIDLVDHINDLATQCEAAGFDINAEHVRIVALNSRVKRDAQRVLRLRSGATASDTGIVAELAVIQQQQQRRVRWRIGTIAVIVCAIIAAGWYAVVTTPPSADTTGILNAVTSGDLAMATQLATREARTFPDDLETQVWLAVLAEHNGDAATAAAAWHRAQQLGSSPGAVLYMRGNNRLLLTQYDGAQADAAALLANPITRPEGLFLQGGIAEAQGDVKGAIVLMRQAADAAEAAHRDEFAVIIRIRMGGLMQYGMPQKP